MSCRGRYARSKYYIFEMSRYVFSGFPCDLRRVKQGVRKAKELDYYFLHIWTVDVLDSTDIF